MSKTMEMLANLTLFRTRVRAEIEEVVMVDKRLRPAKGAGLALVLMLPFWIVVIIFAAHAFRGHVSNHVETTQASR